MNASIGYTDSIPLLAVLFKPFRGVLPEDFQYFALWLLLCFCLQGLFGALLTRTVSENLGVQLLAVFDFEDDNFDSYEYVAIHQEISDVLTESGIRVFDLLDTFKKEGADPKD